MLTLGASYNATIIAPENTFHLVQQYFRIYANRIVSM